MKWGIGAVTLVGSVREMAPELVGPVVHAASAERRGMVHGIVGSQCQFGISGFVISVGRLDI